jgi:hypothetical protein
LKFYLNCISNLSAFRVSFLTPRIWSSFIFNCLWILSPPHLLAVLWNLFVVTQFCYSRGSSWQPSTKGQIAHPYIIVLLSWSALNIFNEIVFHVAPNFVSTSIKVKLFFSRHHVITSFSFFSLFLFGKKSKDICWILCTFVAQVLLVGRDEFCLHFRCLLKFFLTFPGVYIWKGN